MSIERVGQFVEFKGEDGLLTLVRISSIQIAAESDPTGNEVLLTAANRTFKMHARLRALRNVLADERPASAKG